MAETMTKKWNRAPFGPERVEEMERYLNKMSHEGWQCCEIVRDELRFVRGEQDEYIYRVQYFYESRDGEKDDYLRTLGETGAALVLLSGRHAYKAISQYGFSSWLDTQLDSPVYMVLTILIVAGLLAGGIAGMISVRREGKKIEELKRRRMIEE